MRIGFITDEISSNVEEAIALGAAWGVRDFELRMITGARVPRISGDEVEQLLRLQQRHGLRFTALSPGVFKGAIHEHARLEHELQETLPQTYQLARLLRTPTIIVFGFKRDLPAMDAKRGNERHAREEEKILEALRRAAKSAEQYGLTLAVENEPGFWCDTGSNTARILAQVNASNLRANWDPGNAMGESEEPYPHGYEALKQWIGNVHVKDTSKGALVECVPLGEGKVDWPGQLQALARDQIVAHVTIETHCAPLRENSKRNLEYVRRVLSASDKK